MSQAMLPDQLTKSLIAGLGDLLSTQLKRLFEHKHLYQTIEIKVEDALLERARRQATTMVYSVESSRVGARPPVARAPDPTMELASARAEAERMLRTWPWGPMAVGGPPPQSAARSAGERGLSFMVGMALANCPQCEERYPSNLVGFQELMASHGSDRGGLAAAGRMAQVFAFNFQCQGCGGFPVVLLVHRVGAKVALSGRAPIEIVRVPQEVPKRIRCYYSDAVVASQSGKTLAGLFYLRVLIEQFCYSGAGTEGLQADQAIARYMDSLPNDFKDHVASLQDIYSKLSDALHKAREDTDLFESSLKDIQWHFAARQVRHDLREWGPPGCSEGT